MLLSLVNIDSTEESILQILKALIPFWNLKLVSSQLNR